ncbi:hypothetical protein, partial [Intrasporangium mesophilum]
KTRQTRNTRPGGLVFERRIGLIFERCRQKPLWPMFETLLGERGLVVEVLGSGAGASVRSPA